MESIVVRTELLGRRFGNAVAVSGLTLDVLAGEIYCLLGANGAGKSTTVRMLATLLKPSSGTATIFGFDVERQARDIRPHIGVALQEASLDPAQTGHELLAFHARLYGLKGNDARRQVAAMAELSGLGASLSEPVSRYSGGMHRRLDLVVAMVHGPRLLFLDEPTTGLDPHGRLAMWDHVRGLRDQFGVTVILTTQYLEEAEALADRVGIMGNGRLIVEGSPSELKKRVAADVVEISLKEDPALALPLMASISGCAGARVQDDRLRVEAAAGSELLGPLLGSLHQNGFSVVTAAVRSPTLEDVFFHVQDHEFAGDPR